MMSGYPAEWKLFLWLYNLPRTGGLAASAGLVQVRLKLVSQESGCSTCLGWQAPDNKKARMYKVLKEVLEDNQSGSTTESTVPLLNQYVWDFPKTFSGLFGFSKACLSGRVRDGAAKNLLSKQLSGVGAAPDFMNLQNGSFRPKKAKKEKSPMEESMADMKKLLKKIFVCMHKL